MNEREREREQADHLMFTARDTERNEKVRVYVRERERGYRV